MTIKVTAAQLISFARMPAAIASVLAPSLEKACNDHGITDYRRFRHFIATCAVETGGLQKLEENLNYSEGSLLTLFGRHRISAADARKFGRTKDHSAHQNALANILYGGAFGKKNLGNTEPGDGWKYRGRSLIMATGRANYALLEKLTGLPLLSNPDMAADPRYAAVIAAKWWENKGLNQIADADAGERVYASARLSALNNEMDDALQERRRVNGGTIGLHEFKAYLLETVRVWPLK